MISRVLLRVDASKEIGFGHAFRTMTLAKELKDRERKVSVVGRGIGEVRGLAKSFAKLDVLEMAFDTPEDDVSFIKNWRPDLVLADGYHFCSEFFELLKGSGLCFGVVDDNAETRANNPDFLLNQNPNAVREMYPKEWLGTKFLLGMNSLLIREEIVNLISSDIVHSAPSTLVAIGGTDVRQLTPKIATSLADRGHAVAVPSGQLKESSSRLGEASSGVFHTFSSHGYAAALSSSTLAVLGGGSSLYEALCLGVPTIAVIVVDNQANIATKLLRQGLIHGLVDFRHGVLQDNLDQLIDVHSRVLEGPTSVLSFSDRLELSAGKKRAAEELLEIS